MTAICNFHYIGLEKYLDIQGLKGKEREDRKKAILHYDALRAKNTPCEVCGNDPIWVTGSALVEWCGCFTCITGESDASNDYEV